MIQVLRWKDFAGKRSGTAPLALTIGAFDSLHVGHQRLIRAVTENRYGARPAVCTFSENPAKVLGNRPFMGSILSFRQKMEKLEGLRIALVVLIDFSPEISTLSGKEFLELLDRSFEIKKLVVGYDFHMGQRRETGVAELVGILKDSDTELEVVPATVYHRQVVSSSRIRQLIQQAQFQDVREMLQDDFRLDLRGVAVERRQSSRCVRRSGINQVLPRIGEYQVRFQTDSREFPGTLTVDERQLSWQNRPADDKVMEIRFTA